MRLDRNIMGQIIRLKYNDTYVKTNKIDDKMYNVFIGNMRAYMYYLNINNITDISKSIYKKTIYYDKVNEVVRVMNNSMTEMESNILLLGAGYNILIETCMVLSMIKTISKIQPLITNLCMKKGKYIMINEMKQVFSSDSDITSIYNICNRFKNTFKNMEIFNLIDIFIKGGNMNKANMYVKQYETNVILYRMKQFNELSSDKKIRYKYISLFNWLQSNGLLDNKRGFMYWLSESGFLRNKLYNDLDLYKKAIEELCNTLYLDYEIILEYFDTLINNVISIISAEKDIDSEYNEISVFKWMEQLTPTLSKHLKTNIIEFKLNLCFFFAQPFIAVKNNNDYISLRDGSILSINYIFNKMNTLCNKIGSYLYYFNTNDNKMSLIANIDPHILPIYFPIHYNTLFIKTSYNIFRDNKITTIHFDNTEYIRLVSIITNNCSLVGFPFNSNLLPVIQEYVKSIRL